MFYFCYDQFLFLNHMIFGNQMIPVPPQIIKKDRDELKAPVQQEMVDWDVISLTS